MTTREQFLQRLRRYCRENGLEFEVMTKRGKGSHYLVRAGSKTTTVQSGVLPPHRIKGLLKQLGLPGDAF